jgi:hypothetical protein
MRDGRRSTITEMPKEVVDALAQPREVEKRPSLARAKILCTLSEDAADLIKLIAVELSGTCYDDDHYWYGPGAVRGMKDILDSLFDKLEENYRVEHEKCWAEREAGLQEQKESAPNA